MPVKWNPKTQSWERVDADKVDAWTQQHYGAEPAAAPGPSAPAPPRGPAKPQGAAPVPVAPPAPPVAPTPPAAAQAAQTPRPMGTRVHIDPTTGRATIEGALVTSTRPSPAPPVAYAERPGGKAGVPAYKAESNRILASTRKRGDAEEHMAEAASTVLDPDRPVYQQKNVVFEPDNPLWMLPFTALEPFTYLWAAASYAGGVLGKALLPSPSEEGDDENRPVGDAFRTLASLTAGGLGAASAIGYGVSPPGMVGAVVSGPGKAATGLADYVKSWHQGGGRLYDALASGEVHRRSEEHRASIGWKVPWTEGKKHYVPYFAGADAIDITITPHEAADLAEKLPWGPTKVLALGLTHEFGRAIIGGAMIEGFLDPINWLGPAAGSKVVMIGNKIYRVSREMDLAGQGLAVIRSAKNPMTSSLEAVQDLARAGIHATTTGQDIGEGAKDLAPSVQHARDILAEAKNAVPALRARSRDFVADAARLRAEAASPEEAIAKVRSAWVKSKEALDEANAAMGAPIPEQRAVLAKAGVTVADDAEVPGALASLIAHRTMEVQKNIREVLILGKDPQHAATILLRRAKVAEKAGRVADAQARALHMLVDVFESGRRGSDVIEKGLFAWSAPGGRVTHYMLRAPLVTSVGDAFSAVRPPSIPQIFAKVHSNAINHLPLNAGMSDGEQMIYALMSEPGVKATIIKSAGWMLNMPLYYLNRLGVVMGGTWWKPLWVKASEDLIEAFATAKDIGGGKDIPGVLHAPSAGLIKRVRAVPEEIWARYLKLIRRFVTDTAVRRQLTSMGMAQAVREAKQTLRARKAAAKAGVEGADKAWADINYGIINILIEAGYHREAMSGALDPNLPQKFQPGMARVAAALGAWEAEFAAATDSSLDAIMQVVAQMARRIVNSPERYAELVEAMQALDDLAPELARARGPLFSEAFHGALSGWSATLSDIASILESKSMGEMAAAAQRIVERTGKPLTVEDFADILREAVRGAFPDDASYRSAILALRASTGTDSAEAAYHAFAALVKTYLPKHENRVEVAFALAIRSFTDDVRDDMALLKRVFEGDMVGEEAELALRKMLSAEGTRRLLGLQADVGPEVWHDFLLHARSPKDPILRQTVLSALIARGVPKGKAAPMLAGWRTRFKTVQDAADSAMGVLGTKLENLDDLALAREGILGQVAKVLSKRVYADSVPAAERVLMAVETRLAGLRGGITPEALTAAAQAARRTAGGMEALVGEATKAQPMIKSTARRASGEVVGLRPFSNDEATVWNEARPYLANLGPEDLLRAVMATLHEQPLIPEGEAVLAAAPFGAPMGRRMGALPSDISRVVDALGSIMDRYEKLYLEHGMDFAKEPLKMLQDWGVVEHIPHIPSSSAKIATGYGTAAITDAIVNTMPGTGGGGLLSALDTGFGARKTRALEGTIYEINAMANGPGSEQFTMDPILLIAYWAQASRGVAAHDFLQGLIAGGVARVVHTAGAAGGPEKTRVMDAVKKALSRTRAPDHVQVRYAAYSDALLTTMAHYAVRESPTTYPDIETYFRQIRIQSSTEQPTIAVAADGTRLGDLAQVVPPPAAAAPAEEGPTIFSVLGTAGFDSAGFNGVTRVLATVFRDGDPETVLHELTHIVRMLLPAEGDTMALLRQIYGHGPNFVFDRASEELFVQHLIAYIQKGRFIPEEPTGVLRRAFRAVKDLLHRTWWAIKGYGGYEDIHPRMIQMFQEAFDSVPPGVSSLGRPSVAASEDLVPMFLYPKFASQWDILVNSPTSMWEHQNVSMRDLDLAIDALRGHGQALGDRSVMASWMREAPELRRSADVAAVMLLIRKLHISQGVEDIYNPLEAFARLGDWNKVADEMNAAINTLRATDPLTPKVTGDAVEAFFTGKALLPWQIYAPAQIYQALTDTLDMASWTKNARGFKHILDRLNQFWKIRYTVINSAFTAANHLGNTLANILDVGVHGALSLRTQYEASVLVVGSSYYMRYGSLRAAAESLSGARRAGETKGEFLLRLRDRKVFDTAGPRMLMESGFELGDGVQRTGDEAIKVLLDNNVITGAYTNYAMLASPEEDLAEIMAAVNPAALAQKIKNNLSFAEDVGFLAGNLVIAGPYGALITLPKSWGRTLAQFTEDYARAINFRANMRRGGNIEESAQHVQKFLFDYDDMTAFQKVWMRTLIPFLTWPVKNLYLHAQMMFEKPAYYAWYHRLMSHILPSICDAATAEATGEPFVERDYTREQYTRLRPNYAVYRMRFPAPGQKNLWIEGFRTPVESFLESTSILAGIASLPLAAIESLFSHKTLAQSLPGGDVAASMRWMSQMHFAARLLLELAFDRNFYYGRPLSELSEAKPIMQAQAELRKYAEWPAPFGPLALALADLIKDQFGIFEVTDEKGTIRSYQMITHAVLGSPWRQAVMNDTAGADLYHISLTDPDAVAPIQEWARRYPRMWSLLDAYTGFRIVQEDPARQVAIKMGQERARVQGEYTTRKALGTFEAPTAKE